MLIVRRCCSLMASQTFWFSMRPPPVRKVFEECDDVSLKRLGEGEAWDHLKHTLNICIRGILRVFYTGSCAR